MKLVCPYLTILVVFLCAIHHPCIAQEDEQGSLLNFPSRYFDKVSQKASSLNEKLDATTAKALASLQKRQDKLKSRLYKTDSIAAKKIFNEAEDRYHSLKQKLDNPRQLTQYIPFLDTLKTSLKFLDKNKELLSKVKGMEGKLDGSIGKINNLEGQLQKAEAVKQFLKEQKRFLKEQLEKFGFAKQLKKLNKDVYYYSQQVNEYKEIIKDPKRIERKAIDIISRTKLFQDFMKKNSMLASLFRMPSDDPNDPAYLQSLAGLQTRAQVNQLVQDQLGSSTNGLQTLQGNVQQAQGMLQQLKDKAASYGNSATDDDMPDPIAIGFKPNPQKTKSFLKRLEYGTNSQSTRGNGFLPVTSDVGLSVGYKLNDKGVIGIGASYKVGWGKDIRHIKISHQGMGLRSYIDYKLKATTWKMLEGFWLSGGFEMNYHSEIKSIDQLKNYSAWQQSGLIGLSKKFSINTKFFKNTKVRLLWDFLSYQQVPRAQPVVFRVGYNF
jgi:hypothetical protein